MRHREAARLFFILRNRFICIHFLSQSAVQTRDTAISYTQNVSPSFGNSFGTALEQRHCPHRRNEAIQNLPRHPPPPFLHPHPRSSASTTLSAYNTRSAPLQLQPQYRTQPDQHSIPEVSQSHISSGFSTEVISLTRPSISALPIPPYFHQVP